MGTAALTKKKGGTSDLLYLFARLGSHSNLFCCMFIDCDIQDTPTPNFTESWPGSA